MKLRAQDGLYGGDKGWDSDQQLFAKVTVTWKQWLGRAGEHLQTAQVLLPEINSYNALLESLREAKVQSARIPSCVIGQYFFHCAMAVENAFKGVMSFTSSITIEQSVLVTGRLPKTLLGHDLRVLAKRAGHEMNIDDEYVLAFLTRYGIWGGKYPLPIDNRNYALTTKLSNGKHYFVGGWHSDKVPLYLTFACNVCQWARSAIEDSSQAGELNTGE